MPRLWRQFQLFGEMPSCDVLPIAKRTVSVCKRMCIVPKLCKIGLSCVLKLNRNVGSRFWLVPFSTLLVQLNPQMEGRGITTCHWNYSYTVADGAKVWQCSWVSAHWQDTLGSLEGQSSHLPPSCAFDIWYLRIATNVAQWCFGIYYVRHVALVWLNFWKTVYTKNSVTLVEYFRSVGTKWNYRKEIH